MWNTDDLDFDGTGKLIIKDSDLALRLKQLMEDNKLVAIDLNAGCVLDGFCPGIPIPQPPPDGMCICVVQDMGTLIRSKPPSSG